MDPWFNVAANLNISPEAASKDTHIRLVNTVVARYILAAGFPAHSSYLLSSRLQESNDPATDDPIQFPAIP